METTAWMKRNLTVRRGMLCIGGLFLIVDPLMLSPSSYLGFGLIIAVGMLIHCLMRRSFSAGSLVATGLVLAVVFTSALYSGFAYNALEFGLVVFAAAGFALILSARGRGDLERDLFVFFLVVGGFHLFYSGYEYVRQLRVLGSLGLYRYPVGLLRNPNIAGRFFALTGLMVLALDRSMGGRWWRITAGGVFVLAAVLTGSRGTMLGVLFAPVPLVWKWTGSENRPWWIAGALLVLFVGTFLLVGNLTQVTNLQRIELVPETLELVNRRPLLGVGGWNFGLVYPSVSGDARWQRHPHSLPLIVLAEYGMIGGIVGIGLVIWWLRGSWNGLFLGPVVFLMIHEGVDTMVWLPGVVLLMVPAPVMALRQTEPPTRRLRWPAVVLALSMLLLCGRAIWVTRDYRNGLAQARGSRWSEAASSWRGHAVGFVTAHRALSAWKRGRRSRSVRLLRRAGNQNLYDPFYPYLLGELLERMGRSGEARRARARARRLDPRGMLREPLVITRSDTLRPTLRSTEDLPAPSRVERAVRTQPRRADSYFGLVDRTIRRGAFERALRQLDVLDGFSYRTRPVRRSIIERRILIYNLASDPARRKRWAKRLRQLGAKWIPARRQYHHFFYRRSGLDYAFFR